MTSVKIVFKTGKEETLEFNTILRTDLTLEENAIIWLIQAGLELNYCGCLLEIIKISDDSTIQRI